MGAKCYSTTTYSHSRLGFIVVPALAAHQHNKWRSSSAQLKCIRIVLSACARLVTMIERLSLARLLERLLKEKSKQ